MQDDPQALLTLAGRALYGEQWQAPLARDLHVHRDTVQDWRQGRSRPRRAIYKEIASLMQQRREAIDGIIPMLDAAARE